jgi:cyclase
MSLPARPSRAFVGDPVLEEVANGVYAYIQPDGSWWINNTGFVVGPDAIVSVDSCATEARTTAYRMAIGRVSTLPVQTLVNTHHHGDHTNGNYLFREATIIAQTNCRTEMLATGLPGERTAHTWEAPDWGALQQALPSVTFDDQLEIWSGDSRCEVRFAGMPAHTTSDSIFWMPDQSILFAGDLLFNGGTPFVLGGSLKGAIEALRVLESLAAKTIVPGHGPICGPEVIGQVLGYLRFVEDLARRAVDAQISPLEAALEADLGDYAGLLDCERIVANLHRAYAELKTDAQGPGRVDRHAALRDMVAYNGGRRLTCHA